jgi:Domain of unknown function (DUF4381)
MTVVTILLTLAIAAAPAAPAGPAPKGVPVSSAPTPVRAGAAPVVTRFTAPPKLTVGDRFDVTYVVTGPHPSLVTGPLADSLGAFVIVAEKRHTARHGDVDETTYRMGAACFKTGRQRLPALRFLVTSGDRTDTLSSDTVVVTIASVLPATMKDIHGLKPAESFPNLWLWLVPAIVLLLTALAFFGHRLLRRLRRIHALEAPPLPPWEEALAALDGMPWQEWLATGQVKRFYYALSEILKRYLERRFEFDAVEQTTTELLASLRAQRLPMRDDIGRFFALYDLVKYAKTVPPVEESERAIDQLREFIIKTQPQPPAPVVAPTGAQAATAPGAS